MDQDQLAMFREAVEHQMGVWDNVGELCHQFGFTNFDLMLESVASFASVNDCGDDISDAEIIETVESIREGCYG